MFVCQSQLPLRKYFQGKNVDMLDMLQKSDILLQAFGSEKMEADDFFHVDNFKIGAKNT